ncbi:Predicted kinase [Paenibacillus uliginis N3/975]|uniref:Predicted kinase n=1 Tax=Paenibacillus uliginis N3/975 TaxID=1313296 RepID=A0A1X7HHN1_9BACL|nr:ATP-binding protein [Paenibacillus uliginis]SMF86858.1 Predicted kinase [Paenibacillus uliginis N3/975]
MECVIFIGIQASGKSTFYKEKFFKTHMRINLDMLRSRNREDVYLAASIEAKQPFVVDNTNPTIDDRKKYIDIARKNKFKVVGYYFEPDYELSYARNEQREGKEKVREIGLKSTLKKLQIPTYDEGFDELYFVKSADGKFEVEKML